MVNYNRIKQIHQQSKGSQSVWFGEEGRSRMLLPAIELGEVSKEPLDIVFDTKTKRIYALCPLGDSYYLRSWTLDGKRQSNWLCPKHLKPNSIVWGESNRICLVLQNLDEYQQTYGKYKEIVGRFQEGTLEGFQTIETSPLKTPDNDPKYSNLIESVRQLMRKTGFEPIPGWGAKTAVPAFQSSVNFFPVIARDFFVAHSSWTDDLSVVCLAPRELLSLLGTWGIFACRKQSGDDYRISSATNRLFEAIGVSPDEALFTKHIRVLSIEVSARMLLLSLAISPQNPSDKQSIQKHVVLWLDIKGESIEPRQKESGILARTLKRY